MLHTHTVCSHLTTEVYNTYIYKYTRVEYIFYTYDLICSVAAVAARAVSILIIAHE